jgi:OOP family OmpA-OmpF porin
MQERESGLPFRHKLNSFAAGEVINGCGRVCLADLALALEVDAEAITTSLKRDGKIALYGISFDTNKAVLRDDSTTQLGEMASVLKSAPTLNVFIVGHTDNQGELAANTSLSQKRAEVVAAALSTKYAIAPARLVPRGVANLTPVSSNDSEEGRAKNRRVEMVVR